MTTIEMIDKMLDRLTPGTDPHYWCEAIRARVESERAALREAVEEIEVERCHAAQWGQVGAMRAYMGSLDIIAEKTGVRHGE